MKYTREQYAKALYRMFSSVKESEVKTLAKKCVLFLRRNGDMRKAREIVEHFSEYCDEKLGRKRARIISARPLRESEKKLLTKIIGESIGKKIDAEESVDPSLLGGVKVQVGDEVFDFTVLRRLRSFGK